MKTIPMLLRDQFALLNGKETAYKFGNGIEIVTQGGQCLFEISLRQDGSLEIRCNGTIKHDKTILDDNILVEPHSSNSIFISRKPYKK